MLTLTRVAESEFGIIGFLSKDSHPFCWTLESLTHMIPEGDYEVVAKGNQLEIILPNGVAFFTSGETQEEAQGNILLGFKVYSPRCLADTQRAIYEFQKVMKNTKETTLSIRRL